MATVQISCVCFKCTFSSFSLLFSNFLSDWLLKVWGYCIQCISSKKMNVCWASSKLPLTSICWDICPAGTRFNHPILSSFRTGDHPPTHSYYSISWSESQESTSCYLLDLLQSSVTLVLILEVVLTPSS